jgi:hypothetical protein
MDADRLDAPSDYYTTISEALEAAGESRKAELDPRHLLYMFEFYKNNKFGSINIFFVVMEWPGIRVSQAILNLLNYKGIKRDFITDVGE